MPPLPFDVKAAKQRRQPSSPRVLGLAWLVVFAFAMTCFASAVVR